MPHRHVLIPYCPLCPVPDLRLLVQVQLISPTVQGTNAFALISQPRWGWLEVENKQPAWGSEDAAGDDAAPGWHQLL